MGRGCYFKQILTSVENYELKYDRFKILFIKLLEILNIFHKMC